MKRRPFGHRNDAQVKYLWWQPFRNRLHCYRKMSDAAIEIVQRDKQSDRNCNMIRMQMPPTYSIHSNIIAMVRQLIR